MYSDFNELINSDELINDKSICISRILFDEYKFLASMGFYINYSLISAEINKDAQDAEKCILHDKIDQIQNKNILKFVKLNWKKY